MTTACELPTHLREGTDDAAIWQDVYVGNEYGVTEELVAGKTVLDVGCGVGAFAARCLEAGAAKVIGVEPNAETCGACFNGLRGPLVDGRFTLFEGAAWSGTGEGMLRLHTDGVRSGDTLVFYPPGRGVRVDLVDFAGLLWDHQPDVLKLDCEGSEYELLRAVIPRKVVTMWVEFHESYREPWSARRKAIVNDLLGSGWSRGVLKDSTTGHVLCLFRR